MPFRMMSVVPGLLLVASVSAAEFNRGQALYENQCVGCHETWAHSRADRKMKSMEDLRQRVASWSVHSGLDWTDEDIDDVTDYLNRQFYRIEAAP